MSIHSIGQGVSTADSPRARRGRRGYVLFSLAAVAVVLMAFAGLVIDVGYLEHTKRRVQTAADAGAIAGTREILLGHTGITDAVRADVTKNGYTNGVNGATVTVNNPPLSGLHVADPSFVEVIVKKNLATSFMQVLQVSSMAAAARSVGGPAGADACIYALNLSQAGAFSAGGTVALNSTCGIMVNSMSPTALDASHGACIDAPAAGVVGGYSITSVCTNIPSLVSGLPPAPDPLGWLAPPTIPTKCDHNNYHTAKNEELSPGTYCGGIQVSGGAVLTMDPGLYILNGGGFKVTGGSTINGNGGVTIFDTADASHTFDTINFAGGTIVDLVAPTTGTYAGILFFGDRTLAAGTNNFLTGTSDSTWQGTIYFPTANVTFSGTSDTTAYTILITDTITLNGNTSIHNDYSSLAGGAPIKMASIVE